jgi:hypothetical protein
MQTTLKNIELLQHFKISKTAPTCFGLKETIIRELQSKHKKKLHTWLKVDM